MTNVTLPNGTVIKGIPEGTSKEDVRLKAIDAGLATEADFPSPAAPEGPPEVNSGGFLDFLKGNVDIPAGIAGAMAGGRYGGSVAGPKGGIVGSVIGGAMGTFGGSLASDALTQQDVDFGNATKEAMISAGMDVAFLGASKWAWPLIKSLRSNGKSVEDAVQFFGEVRQGGDVGSLGSRKASQAILQEGGATLTPTQTGRARGYQIIGERLARTGIFSQGAMDANAARVSDVVGETLESLINKGDMAPGHLGDEMYSVITAGKHALQKEYTAGLDGVRAALGNSTVDLGPLKKAYAKMMREAQISPGEYRMNDAVFQHLQQKIKNLADVPNMKATDFLDYQKKLFSDLHALTTNDMGVLNQTIDADVAQVTRRLEGVLQDSLNQVDLNAGLKYRAVRKAYSEGMDALLPVLNKSFITSASKGDVARLGTMLSSTGNAKQAAAFMASINRAYAQINRLRGPARREALAALPFKTADEARQAVSQSYLRELFPSVGPTFDIADYKTLSQAFESGDRMAKLSAVAGPDTAKRVKQLLNLMTEASETPRSAIGELMLRAKEYGALGAVGSAVVGGGSTLVASGLGVLLSPIGLARIATDPVHTNKLLAYGATRFKTAEAAQIAFVNMFGDLTGEILGETAVEADNE